MKRYLLSEKGNFYKANLHCHTNLSDAIWSPEKVKEEYKKRGYSIVAYTDHDVLIPHNDLADDDFLPLNGYEIEVTEGYERFDVRFDNEFKKRKTCHMCLIALRPDNLKQVCWHRTEYLFGHSVEYRDKVVFDETKPDFVREYNPRCITEIMKEARENDFFVTYNHPVWSMENYDDYINYNNMHAMEIFNTCSVASGYDDYVPYIYDEMLRAGKRIFCIAADDNHNGKPADSRKCDSFGGFTMIKAESLDYKKVADALLKGNFYASTGPEIKELWFEDGKIHIKCSPADKISISAGRRRAVSEYAENGEELTYASFEVYPEDIFVRLTVTDKYGKNANTNGYFTDELFK